MFDKTIKNTLTVPEHLKLALFYPIIWGGGRGILGAYKRQVYSFYRSRHVTGHEDVIVQDQGLDILAELVDGVLHDDGLPQSAVFLVPLPDLSVAAGREHLLRVADDRVDVVVVGLPLQNVLQVGTPFLKMPGQEKGFLTSFSL